MLLAIAAVAAFGVAAVYLVFVRTAWGQRVDDLAFDGRTVVDPAVTTQLDELLDAVTRSTLFLLTAAIVLFGLARRRVRLAVTAGAAITASVVTSEVLKNHVLSRPELDDVAGIMQNSYPSGHATIGMALSLGMVMVAPHRLRWPATAAAVILSIVFGIGVLATGWHRPSDTVGAYLVCIAWFAILTAALLRWRGAGAAEQRQLGTIEARLSPPVAALAGVLAVVAAIVAGVETLQADGLRTVEYATGYFVVCSAIVVLAAIIVIGYAQLLRGVALDPPSVRHPRAPSTSPTNASVARRSQPDDVSSSSTSSAPLGDASNGPTTSSM